MRRAGERKSESVREPSRGMAGSPALLRAGLGPGLLLMDDRARRTDLSRKPPRQRPSPFLVQRHNHADHGGNMRRRVVFAVTNDDGRNRALRKFSKDDVGSRQ